MESIEELFLEEVKEKRRAGSGVFHKTGKRGYVGTLRTAIDFLKGKEKQLYKGNGKVVKYVDYSVVLTYDNFIKLPEEEQIKRLKEWRQNLKNKEIAEKMGIEQWKLYELYKKYNIPTKSGKSMAVAITSATARTITDIEVLPAQRTGFFVRFDGTYEGSVISDKILKLASVLDGESTKYKVTLMIEETV